MRIYIIIFALFIFICKDIVEPAERIRYLSTERPVIEYYNRKYIRYVNVTSRRRRRGDPFYYIDCHGDVIYGADNNWTVDYIFYELLTNRYRRSFVEMHFKLCDLVHKNAFFGDPLRQGRLNQSCPFPPGEYHLYNMTIPVKEIPHNFPFTRGRILANVTGTFTNELIGTGYIDMEIKETRFKQKHQ